jgi:hypothetical protein
MKKIAIFAIAIVTASVFASCGNTTQTETTSTDSTQVQADSTATPADSTAATTTSTTDSQSAK